MSKLKLVIKGPDGQIHERFFFIFHNFTIHF
jgi:hypothetical protein